MRRYGRFIELLLEYSSNYASSYSSNYSLNYSLNYAAGKLSDGTLNWVARILNPNRGDEDDPIWHLRKN
jgi:hypothetical protein